MSQKYLRLNIPKTIDNTTK